jgi:hypothetical protein
MGGPPGRITGGMLRVARLAGFIATVGRGPGCSVGLTPRFKIDFQWDDADGIRWSAAQLTGNGRC